MATDKRLVEDLNRLLDIPTARRLPSAPARGPVEAGRGYAQGPEPKATEAGGGIASPLTEAVDADGIHLPTTRTYHPLVQYTSTDGLFVIEVKPISQLDLVDDDGETVVFNFGKPIT